MAGVQAVAQRYAFEPYRYIGETLQHGGLHIVDMKVAVDIFADAGGDRGQQFFFMTADVPGQHKPGYNEQQEQAHQDDDDNPYPFWNTFVPCF